MFSATEILDLAIQIEENGEQFYRQAMTGSSDPSLREMLFWFAEQEKRHRDFFVKMKSSLSDESSSRWAEQLSGTILKGAVADHLFSLDEVDLDSIADVNELLQVALDLEQDTIMFYEIIASFITERKILEQLKAIIKEEQKHIELFRERQGELDEAENDVTGKTGGQQEFAQS
jgi:rubrerythrin